LHDEFTHCIFLGIDLQKGQFEVHDFLIASPLTPGSKAISVDRPALEDHQATWHIDVNRSIAVAWDFVILDPNREK